MKIIFILLALASCLMPRVSDGAQRVQFEGEVEVVIEDRRDDTAATHHWLDTPAGKKRLRIPPGIARRINERRRLITGDRLRVQGLDDGQQISVETVEPLSSVAPGALGPQSVLVMLVNFSDRQTQPYTQAQARAVMSQVSQFYRDNSFGKTWLTDLAGNADAVDIVGWTTLATALAGCPYGTVTQQANAAASAAGINWQAYKRRVYAFPDIGCSWWGLGSLGGATSWVDGSFELAVVAHEIGHNFGLEHSHSLCAPGCGLNEYGDGWCTMGNARGKGHFSAPQKERLGWLDYAGNPPITAVTASGRYRIGAFETQVSEAKALKVFQGLNTLGQRLNLYVEYRVNGRFDTLQKGVTVRQANEADPYGMTLRDLDQVTSSTDWLLDIGQTFADPAAALTISVASTTPAEALIDVALGPVAPLAAPANLAIKTFQFQ